MAKTLDQLCAELELLQYRRDVMKDSIMRKREEISQLTEQIFAKRKEIDEVIK